MRGAASRCDAPPLSAEHGGVRERRDQLKRPAYSAPELLAERPNELWSWEITKLNGPAKWSYFSLYVILDVYSHNAVGWTVQHRENAQVAEALTAQTTEQQQITPATLTVDADRGSSMTSKPVGSYWPTSASPRPTAALHLDRQPVLRSRVQDAEVPPELPRAL